MNTLKFRKMLLRQYGHLYRRTTRQKLDKCSYCGGLRECLDHVPPISVTDSLNIEEYQKSGGKFLLYPSCLECNALLNAYRSDNFYDRLDYLSRKYEKKLEKKELWSERELEEMGRMLQNYIRSHQYDVRRFINKLAAIEEKKTDISIEDDYEEDLY